MADDTADQLRAAGIHVTDDELTLARAAMDQASAEAKHLINHGLAIHRGTAQEGIQEGVLIRSHIGEHGDLPESAIALLTALAYRGGCLAHTVLELDAEKNALAAELAAVREGQK